jgi:hypothetical protein
LTKNIKLEFNNDDCNDDKIYFGDCEFEIEEITFMD